MSSIFVATLGQRPEAITIALDLLRERYPVQALGILHTEPEQSPIAQALNDLRAVVHREYPDIQVEWHEIRRHNGAPLIDIVDEGRVEDYFYGVLRVLLGYKKRDDNIHLMVAGGRKAMSIYAVLAAALIFDDQDRVWTVLSPPEMVEKPGLYHIPPGLRQHVHLVELPLLPARLDSPSLRAAEMSDLQALIAQRQNRRRDFLSRLTAEESRLAETLSQFPYATNEELARLLNKSRRTVENQLAAIYDKMVGYLDLGHRVADKRQALLDLVRDR